MTYIEHTYCRNGTHVRMSLWLDTSASEYVVQVADVLGIAYNVVIVPLWVARRFGYVEQQKTLWEAAA